MSSFKYISILASLIVWGGNINGQITTTIAQQGIVSTCYSNFIDSDANAGNYGANENYTITMCSDGAANTNALNFFFSSFDVDASDALTVYDGNSISAPLIGSYNNSNPIPGNIITSTTTNTSGCLTFVFQSDGVTEGTGWTAMDSCILVCQPINAVISTTPNASIYAVDSIYTEVCFGDQIDFSASGTYPDQAANPYSYSQNDGNTTFEWYYGDGATGFGASSSYTYGQQNGFLVWLKITDVMGCVEYEKHKVRMGITPIFSGISSLEDTVCFQGENTLFGGYNTATSTVVGSSPPSGQINAGGIVADTVWLPDGTGTSYTSSIEIIGFEGQIINNASDIQDICMNIEHSYFGDLTMQIVCPNGSSVILMDPSGGTFLGDAVDNETQGDYGIGMDYCFDENTTWGTMAAEDAAGNWIPATLEPGSNILSPGSFQPDQPFSNLIGCPIDGTWTILITDNAGVDDGYIYSWGLNLNPSINPDAETYTVSLVNGEWLPDPSITGTTQDYVTVEPTTSGNVSYTFEVTDEYGCVFDTSISFVVLPEITMNAGNDTTICVGQAFQLNGSQQDVSPVPPCLFTLEMNDNAGDGWDGASIDFSVNGSSTNYTVGSGSDQSIETFTLNEGDQITLTYNSGSFESEHSFTLTDCNGNVIVNEGPPPSSGFDISYTYGNPFQYGYIWTPATGLSDNSILDPTCTTSSDITYALIGYPIGFPQCASAPDSITITVDSMLIPYLLGDTALCIGNGVTLAAINGVDYLWPDNSTNQTVFVVPTSDTTIIVEVTTSCIQVSLVHDIVVNPLPIPISSPDTSINVDQSVELWSSGGIFYEWTSGITLNCDTCDTVIATPQDDITYYIQITDTNGCIANDTIIVSVDYYPLFVPNGFSPNNDGENDILYVRGAGVASMTFQVFNKWGDLVFESHSLDSGWDGTFRNKPLNTAVFMYRLEAVTKDARNINMSGNVTLFK